MDATNFITFRNTIESLNKEDYRAFAAMTENGAQVTFNSESTKSIFNDSTNSVLVVRASTNYRGDNCKAYIETMDYDTLKWASVEVTREGLLKILESYDSNLDMDEWGEFFKTSKMFTIHNASNLQNKYKVVLEDGKEVYKEDNTEDINTILPQLGVY